MDWSGLYRFENLTKNALARTGQTRYQEMRIIESIFHPHGEHHYKS